MNPTGDWLSLVGHMKKNGLETEFDVARSWVKVAAVSNGDTTKDCNVACMAM